MFQQNAIVPLLWSALIILIFDLSCLIPDLLSLQLGSAHPEQVFEWTAHEGSKVRLEPSLIIDLYGNSEQLLNYNFIR